MANGSLTQSLKARAYSILRYQGLLCLGMVVFWGLIKGRNAAVSAALGAVILLIPTAFALARHFKYTGARQAKLIFYNMVWAEVGKLILTAGLMIAALMWFHPTPLPFFTTLLMGFVAHWIALLTLKRTI